MIGHIEALDRLGIELEPELATDVILQSLPLSFEPFILNYHMNNLNKTLTELHGMLKTAEDSIKKTATHMMMIQRDRKKRKRKGKGKGKAEDRIQKPKTNAKPKDGPSPSDKCFHYGDCGYWSRNCHKYLEEKKKNGSETSTSGTKTDLKFCEGQVGRARRQRSKGCCVGSGHISLVASLGISDGV
ncbi:hypothetical protein BS78_K179400 [Paspalum vaginatum]|uniref:CCHC-type domain-containing protein n=1 Tax=Paspalum vaginatum TaxID=158149 RepID=A0A9W8CFS8_9POAL|nr:hypothetical protein BS78_K179400 [Paspalum vaginatum]